MIHRALGFLRDVRRNRRRRTTLPRFLTYTVTHRCNARCIMCDSWKMKSEGDLTVAEIDRIFSGFPRMDAVRLTGGEPFVRGDLLEISELVRRHLNPLVLHVTTNGFLSDRILRFCEQRDRRRRLQLLVSLDGVEKKHNHIRGSQMAWKTAMTTLQTLAPRQREWNLRLAVNQTVVDAEGLDQYRQLRSVLQSLEIPHHLVMAYDTSSTYNLTPETDTAPTAIGQFTTFGEFSDESLRDLLDEAEGDLHTSPLAERVARRYYLRGIRNRLLQGRGAPNPPCVALNSHLRLLPDGSVPTCQFNGKKVGDLRQQTLTEIWRCEVASEQRDWVRRCPGCWAECEVLPSAIYTLDLLRAALPTSSASLLSPASGPAATRHSAPAGEGS